MTDGWQICHGDHGTVGDGGEIVEHEGDAGHQEVAKKGSDQIDHDGSKDEAVASPRLESEESDVTDEQENQCRRSDAQHDDVGLGDFALHVGLDDVLNGFGQHGGGGVFRRHANDGEDDGGDGVPASHANSIGQTALHVAALCEYRLKYQ